MLLASQGASIGHPGRLEAPISPGRWYLPIGLVSPAFKMNPSRIRRKFANLARFSRWAG